MKENNQANVSRTRTNAIWTIPSQDNFHPGKFPLRKKILPRKSSPGKFLPKKLKINYEKIKTRMLKLKFRGVIILWFS